MLKNKLFLLAPGFEDNGRREYCPECAEIWGVLAYYPAIRESLEISYVPINKPRQEMVERLGADYQNCPTLCLAEPMAVSDGLNLRHANGYQFLDNARDISKSF